VVDRALDSARYVALLDDLVALLDRPPLTAAAEDRADEVLAAAVRHTAKRLRRRVDAARDDPAETRLHEVRKAVKRVRYTAEVAAEVLGGPAQELVACAKEVQELLGDRQDTVLTRDRSRTLGLAAFAAGENAWTFGLLHGLERARAERAAEQFWQREPALTDAARRAGRVG
jgi:CHAD domain-containing protein